MTTPYPAAAAPPARGMLPWGLGLLSLIGLPWLNLIVSGIVMTAVGVSGARHRSGPAAENSRRAANWGLTVLVILVPCICIWIVALSVEAQGFWPWGVVIIVWGLLSVANLVAAIVGMVQAGRGEVVRVPAIPFLRASLA